jgi:hypothetical protein
MFYPNLFIVSAEFSYFSRCDLVLILCSLSFIVLARFRVFEVTQQQ